MAQNISLLEAVSAAEELPVSGNFVTPDDFSINQNFYIASHTSLARITYSGSDSPFCYSGGYYSDQVWKLYYTPKLGVDFYMIENVKYRYHYLCYNEQNVQCCNIQDNDSRLWKLKYAGNGYYRLINKKNAVKLFLQSGGTFGVYDGPDYDDQLWRLVPEKLPVVMFYAIQCGARLFENSEHPAVYRGEEFSDQHWHIIPVEMEEDKCPRFFFIQNRKTGRKLFHEEGCPLIAYDGNNYPDQHWEVKARGGNFLFINRISKGKIVANREGSVGCFIGEEYSDQSWMLISPNMKRLRLTSAATQARLTFNSSDVWSILPDLNGGYYIQAFTDGGRVFFNGKDFGCYVGSTYEDQVWNIMSPLPDQPEVLNIVNTKFRGKMYSPDSSTITVNLADIPDADKVKGQFHISWADQSIDWTYNEDLMELITDNNMFWLEDVFDSTTDAFSASDDQLSDRNDEQFFGLQGLEDLTEYIYRVCPPEQNIEEAIECNDPDSPRTVSQHVTSGSRIPSRFISTTANEETALLWAFYDMQNHSRPLRNTPLTVVRIRLEAARAIANLCEDCVNLNNRQVREHFVRGATARNFAMSSREVLFQYRIPRSCYDVVANPQCPPQPPERRGRKRKQPCETELVELMTNIKV